MFMEKIEPILQENKDRFVLFPIKHREMWDMYKKAEASFWTAEEIDFSKDMDDWESLSPNEQHFIKTILAFFAASDGIVFENLNLNFGTEVQISEARSFYAYQQHNEMVHGETYSLLLEKYIRDPVEKDAMFRALETVPCIKKKAQWAMEWFDPTKLFVERLIAFACVEGTRPCGVLEDQGRWKPGGNGNDFDSLVGFNRNGFPIGACAGETHERAEASFGD
jgi:ribonucleoside-diphosphate reductase subunit M2